MTPTPAATETTPEIFKETMPPTPAATPPTIETPREAAQDKAGPVSPGLIAAVAIVALIVIIVAVIVLRSIAS